MTISVDTVLAALFVYAPQFYTTDTDRLAYLESLYNLLLCQINQEFLSCCGVSVMAFLMAHYLTLAANPSLGMTSSISEGDLSISYNVSADIKALLLTPYGRSYLDLIKRTTVGTTVTNLPVIFGGINQNMPVTAGCSCGFGWGFGNPFTSCGCGNF